MWSGYYCVFSTCQTSMHAHLISILHVRNIRSSPSLAPKVIHVTYSNYSLNSLLFMLPDDTRLFIVINFLLFLFSKLFECVPLFLPVLNLAFFLLTLTQPSLLSLPLLLKKLSHFFTAPVKHTSPWTTFLPILSTLCSPSFPLLFPTSCKIFEFLSSPMGLL